MKKIQITKYVCEICGTSYKTKEEAELCESRPLSQNKGVKVGDLVLVTGGEGAGHLAKVTSVSVCSRTYGHYVWKQYWHTVSVVADLIDLPGSRLLTFEQYEPDTKEAA